MINLMYLFLTAMLALNVSAEILNAFVLIDSSIRQSTENVNTKNLEGYQQFLAVTQEKPDDKNAAEWYAKALELQQKSDTLTKIIQGYKVELVKAADGPEGDINNIHKKDNNNVGGEVMILGGKGDLLKEQLIEFREYMLSIIDDPESVLGKNIASTLNTDDIESANEEGVMVDWSSSNFEHLPLIAVIAMMSKMQNDIRNVESDMLSYMLNQIGKTDFRFNKIEAIVNAPVSYVRVGEEYRAEVFIAASDSTKAPKIILDNGTELNVENGKGIYNGSTGSPGTFTWGGTIELEQPGSGEIKKFPFKNEYQVVSPTYAVAATKMNVFYIGVPNPIAVTATGKDISATASGSGAVLSRTGNGTYNVSVKSRGNASITVVADGKTMGTVQFRCLPVPDPYATVGGMKGGVIAQATLLAQNFVKAQLDNFVFDLSFPVTGFTVSATMGGFTEEYKATGQQITAQQKGLIRQLKPGNKVYFEDVRCKAPDGTTRKLGSVSLKLR